jgi:hypothetical protein
MEPTFVCPTEDEILCGSDFMSTEFRGISDYVVENLI